MVSSPALRRGLSLAIGFVPEFMTGPRRRQKGRNFTSSSGHHDLEPEIEDVE
jgi:hypothetical protein